MPKITRFNTLYKSPFDLLLEHLAENEWLGLDWGALLQQPTSITSRLIRRIYQDQGVLPEILTKLAQSFHHFDLIRREWANTFLPYKTRRHALKDALLQPFKGLGNILKGCGTLIITAGLTAVTLLYAGIMLLPTMCGAVGIKDHWELIGEATALATTWLIDGVTGIFRGLTQLASVVIFPFRFRARGITTKVLGHQPFENDRGVKKLVMLYHDKNYTDFKNDILTLLDDKLKKAKKQGRVAAESEVQEFLFPHPKEILPKTVILNFDEKKFEGRHKCIQCQIRGEIFYAMRRNNNQTLDAEIIRILKKFNIYTVHWPAKMVMMMGKKSDSPFYTLGSNVNRRIANLCAGNEVVKAHPDIDPTFVLPQRLHAYFNAEKFSALGKATRIEIAKALRILVNETADDCKRQYQRVTEFLQEKGLYVDDRPAEELAVAQIITRP